MKLYGWMSLFCCGLCMTVSAQTKNMWSYRYNLSTLAACMEFEEPTEEINRILARENNSADAYLKALTYAVGMSAGIRPETSGQWDTIPGQGYVWRIKIRAERALSLNLLIENYHLHPGMALFVYDETVSNVAGPFDTRNNRNGGILPVQSIPGNTVIVELDIPLYANALSDFVITNVGYGFRDIPGSGKIVPTAVIGPCHIDVNCPDANHWQREKRSVVRLETTLKSGNTQHCTGVLLNQASDTKKPYILTAHHCIAADSVAKKTVFLFGYEKPTCDTEHPVVFSGISGADLLAAKKELDFTLLELSEDMPKNVNPYYAGWSVSSTAPSSVAGIHHPQGDVKKIAFSETPLTTDTYRDGLLICDADAHWMVKRWDKGSTEKGSSGSPIFDQNRLMVGTLTGGQAKCSSPVNDYYAKFKEQWSKYSKPEESLKTWLDPENKGIRILYGYDPIAPFEGRCDTIGHIGNNEAQILIKSDLWGYLTGHNDKHQTSFAEKITNDTVAKIIGLEVGIGQVYSSGSDVTFSVWAGDEFPTGPPVYAKRMIVQPEYRGSSMHVYFEKTVEITGSYFIGYSIGYNSVDTFAAYQSVRRPYEGLSAMYVEEGGVWKALDKEIPPTYSSLGVRAIGRFGTQQQQQQQQIPYHDLKIVFQPGNNNVFTYFENPEGNVLTECYDVTGKRMPVNETGRHVVMNGSVTYLQIEIDAGNLPGGMYFIRVSDNRKILSGKFIKL